MTTIADAVARSLRDAGVRFLFGVPGGGSNLDLVAAGGRADIPFVLTATETGAAIAALAQSEITGRPAACLTTLGPGVASTVNGVACAWLERAPLLVFTDAAAGRFEHQRLDHRALLAAVTKWSATLDADNAQAVIEQAIVCAMTHPRGPVHIDCPGEVLSRKSQAVSRNSTLVERLGNDDLHFPADDVPCVPVECVRPVLLIGLGARDPGTSTAIRALCATRRIPALVTYKAKGVVADSDPWFAGLFTNGSIERPIVEEADFIVGIGLDEVELLPRPWTYRQPMVRVAGSAVGRLADAFNATAWDPAIVRDSAARQRAAMCVSTGGLAPDRVVQVAAEAAPHARVTVDAGAHMLPATTLWPIDAPNRLLISNGLSTMGFALPAAIGAALLDDGPVVALTGDGGLLMCAGELATAAREQVHVVVVVFNDSALSLIDIKQKQRQLPRSGVFIGGIDWRRLAESVGIPAYAAATEGELAAALARALQAPGPALVDARVDPSGYPAILRAVRG